ncbi:MAG: hypothetical protein HEEMFOPI_01192 [Holosporales bacterium]
MNVFHKVRGSMSKVANDNAVPTNVWFAKFIKVGVVIALITGLVMMFS